jgi:hypothetical protein
MTDYRTCTNPKCGTTVEGRGGVCPTCGAATRNVGESKIRGWLLVGLGLFLVLVMGYIALNTAPTLLRPGVDAGGSRFTGTAEQARTIALLFGAIIAFGATSTVYGIYMLVTGRQNKAFMLASLLLFAVLGYFAWSIIGWKG